MIVNYEKMHNKKISLWHIKLVYVLVYEFAECMLHTRERCKHDNNVPRSLMETMEVFLSHIKYKKGNFIKNL